MHRPPDDVYSRVRDTDPDVLDTEQLAGYVADIAMVRAWCDAQQVRATRRQRSLADEGRAGDPRDSLSRDGRQSAKDAKAASEREQVCNTMPGFEQALANGDVSSGHVDAIANATRNLDDAERSEFHGAADDLLSDATDQSVDTFERNCRDLAKSIRKRHNSRSDVDELERQKAQSKVSRWIDRDTGMHKTLIEADPETDRRIWSAIQRERGRLKTRQRSSGAQPVSFDRLTVDAVASAVSSSPASTSLGGQSVGDRIVVHVGLDRLVDGAPGLCETDSGVSLPVETVRRMACDAEIIPVVLDGDGVVLDEGRRRRLATSEQRLAIEAMHATCSYPSCQVGIDDCRVHHIDYWERGGRTDLDRMAPVCETHHHLIHEGGWAFDITPDRTGTWTRPDATTHWTGTLTDRKPAA